MATNLEQLKEQIESVDSVMSGALQKFGELGGSGNKVWTTFARITSGSWLWRFQARLRALSNVIELVNKAQTDANKEQLEGIKIRADLDDALKGSAQMLEMVAEAQEKLAAGENLDYLLEESDIIRGLKAEYEDWGVTLERTTNIYEELQDRAQKALDINKKGMMGYYKDAATEKFEALKEKIGSPMEFARGVGKAALSAPVKLSMAAGKAFLGITKGLKFFLKLSAQFLKGALLYGFTIILGLMFFVAFARKFFPIFAKNFKYIAGFLEVALNGVINIFTGVFEILKGIWEGDFILIMEGVAKIIQGVIQIAVGVFMAAFTALIVIVHGIWKAIYEVGARLYNGIKNFFGFGKAYGGVTQGGVNLVGEKGPELVKLPAGSRVISNANSRGMGGNTINVHVNGRVGASDAEIRDIANKVAREINIRMNRQGTTTMGG